MTLASFGRALSAAALLLAFGAAGASAASVDEIAQYNKPDRQKVLEDGAKKEGELLWIGGLDERKGSRPILEAFMKKYPFINAKSIRMNTSEALQRILAEHRAKTPRVDMMNGGGVRDLKVVDLAQKIYSPLFDKFPTELKDPDGRAAIVRYTYQGVAAWNTNLVKDPPKTWDALLDPKWKGKLVWTDSADTGAQYLITYLRQIWGEDKAMAYFEKLAKQEPVTRTEAAQNVTDMIVAGEYQVMINPALHHVAGRRAVNAPIDAAMQDPVLARNDPAIVLTTAPHPHATMLLIDFLLDTESQNILKDAQYYPANPTVDPAPEMKPYLPRGFGLKVYSLDETVQYNNLKSSQEIFKKIFQ
jgi:iron(III) transport system substrate-binding protein